MSTEINLDNLKDISPRDIISAKRVKYLFDTLGYTPSTLSVSEQKATLKRVWERWEADHQEDYEEFGNWGPFPGNDDDEIRNPDFYTISTFGGHEGGGDIATGLYLYKPENILFSFEGHYSSYDGTEWHEDSLEIVENIRPVTVFIY